MKWAVLGASGFVGSAIVAEARRLGIDVVEVSAPRLSSSAQTAAELVDEALCSPHVAGLAAQFAGATVVINAAGLATPDATGDGLRGANSLLPAVAAIAAQQVNASRFVHLSSAAVLGHARVLDESAARRPFSAYSASKSLGEEALEDLPASTTNVVSIRATSVQGPLRPTTRSLARIATTPLATVAAPGTASTPVTSVGALAWFVAEVAKFDATVPAIVLQPWEGMTVSTVLTLAGGKKPTVLPRWLARSLLAAGQGLSTLTGGRLNGPLRRVELMWFGQEQVPGWAAQAGLHPPKDPDQWQGLAQLLPAARQQARSPR